jgi:hypothetical protein
VVALFNAIKEQQKNMGIEPEEPAGGATASRKPVATPAMPKESFLSLLKQASQGGGAAVSVDKVDEKPAVAAGAPKPSGKRKWAVLDDDDYVEGSDDE